MKSLLAAGLSIAVFCGTAQGYHHWKYESRYAKKYSNQENSYNARKYSQQESPYYSRRYSHQEDSDYLKYSAQAGQRFFVFDPRRNYWAAYEGNHKVRDGIANGGARGGHETPAGVYTVLTKKGPEYRSHQYPMNWDGTRGGAEMPYAMHFTRSGHAIHGSPGITRQNTSHGCIRVKTDAARWLNEYFMTAGSKVIVYRY